MLKQIFYHVRNSCNIRLEIYVHPPVPVGDIQKLLDIRMLHTKPDCWPHVGVAILKELLKVIFDIVLDG